MLCCQWQRNTLLTYATVATLTKVAIELQKSNTKKGKGITIFFYTDILIKFSLRLPSYSTYILINKLGPHCFPILVTFIGHICQTIINAVKLAKNPRFLRLFIFQTGIQKR